MFTVAILLLPTSCGTTAEIEYVSVISSDEIPDFPILNYYEESQDGDFITVDSFWFQKIAEYKIKISDLKKILEKFENGEVEK